MRIRILAAALVLALAPVTAAHADPPTTGSVSGTLTDGATPVPDAVVELVLPPYGVAIKQTRTDAAGAFRLADAPPRDYAVRFRLAGGLTQFHPAVTDLVQARLVAVVAGADTVVQESVMPHGTIGGWITTDTGAPAAGARVELHRITPGGPLATTLADAGGNYLFRYPPNGQHRVAVAAAERGATLQWAHRRRSWFKMVWPGTYKVMYNSGGQVQWATGERTERTADPVRVAAGGTTQLDEVLLPTGSLAVRAADRASGAAVTAFCATAYSTYVYLRVCTEDGVAELALSAGSYEVTVADDVHPDAVYPNVRVTTGRLTALDARL